MSDLILPPTLAKSGRGYQVNYACRFNDDDSAELHKTVGTADSLRVQTFDFWCKRGNMGAGHYLWGILDSAGSTQRIGFNSDDTLWIDFETSSPAISLVRRRTNRVFRDPAAWLNIHIEVDSNQTDDTSCRVVINGVEETSFSTTTNPSSASDIGISDGDEYVGAYPNGPTFYFDGYLAQACRVDGAIVAETSFGEFDENNVWRPISLSGISFGAEGFSLDFADSGDLGNDVSGNGNDFTSSGLVSNDQVTDTPTTNYPTLNTLSEIPAPSSTLTFADGNLHLSGTNSGGSAAATMAFHIEDATEYEWQTTINSSAAGAYVGLRDVENPTIYGGFNVTTTTTDILYNCGSGDKSDDGWQNNISYGSGVSAGDKVKVRAGNGEVRIFIDTGSGWVDQGLMYSGKSGRYAPMLVLTGSGPNLDIDLGQRGFSPTNNTYKLLNTANLPEPSIKDGSAHFQTTLYTGNGTAIGSGGKEVNQSGNSTFQPDFVWVKDRDAAESPIVYDALRGVAKHLFTNATSAEATDAEGLSSFDADGFTVGNRTQVNTNTDNIVAWQWKTNGSGSANGDGSISSTVSVNTKAGISIVTYTGNGTGGATVGHGLGKTPKFIVIKRSNGGSEWAVYVDGGQVADPETDYLYLNQTAAAADSAAFWNDTAPTSSVFSVGTNTETNTSSQTYVAYCFAEIEGFCKIGSYVGNGSSDGPFIHTGFPPAFVLSKKTETGSSNRNWYIVDSTRDTFNPAGISLFPDSNSAEIDYSGSIGLDLLSNGFKIRTSHDARNESGITYIYIAFAENPFGGKNTTPATAR